MEGNTTGNGAEDSSMLWLVHDVNGTAFQEQDEVDELSLSDTIYGGVFEKVGRSIIGVK